MRSCVCRVIRVSTRKKSNDERIAEEARSAAQQLMDPHLLDTAENVSRKGAKAADSRRQADADEEEFRQAWEEARASGWSPNQLLQLPRVEYRPKKRGRQAPKLASPEDGAAEDATTAEQPSQEF